MLYLINKTPVCSRELGDFPLSAVGAMGSCKVQRGLASSGLGVRAGGSKYERCAQDSPQDCLAELHNLVDCFCSWILTFP